MPGGDPLLDPAGDGALFHRGIALYPAADPRGSAGGRARTASLHPRTLVFIPSVGLGYGLAELLAGLPADCAILCVEADAELLDRASAAGLPRDSRLAVICTREPEVAARAARSLGIGRFRRVVELPLCAGYRLEPRLYADLARALRDLVGTHWRDAATLISLGSLWVRNLFENLHVLPRSCDLLSLSCTAPVVVAGAGPSLEASLEPIRRCREGLVLVAADTALPRLLGESLAPDLVVALEGQVANLQDFLPSPGAQMLLACDLTSHPATARLFPGPVALFSSRFAPLSLFDRLAHAGLLPCPFPPLGSVGVAAARAALGLTRGEVFLAGLDFGYPGAATHARGTAPHRAALHSSRRLCGVDQQSVGSLASRRMLYERNRHGVQVATDVVLRSYRDGLRRECSAEAGRMWDLGTAGLDLGLRSIGAGSFLERIRAAGARSPRLAAAKGSGGPPAGQVAAFLRAEIEILDTAIAAIPGMLAAASSAGGLPPGSGSLLGAIDYAWVHFPDADGGLRAGGDRTVSFLARVRVAAMYYRGRLARLAGRG
jgi:hypothetical protein